MKMRKRTGEEVGYRGVPPMSKKRESIGCKVSIKEMGPLFYLPDSCTYIYCMHDVNTRTRTW